LSPETVNPEQLEALVELSRRKLQGSLHWFLQRAWHLVEPETPFVDGWHLQAICEHLEAAYRGEIRNLVINMPPRHCKSLLCSVFFPVWTWANSPSKNWLCSSYSHGLAVRDSLRSRRIIQSDWFKMRFPNCAIAPDQSQKGRYQNLGGGSRISTTVLGAATGEGGDFILVDDPHKVLDSTSENARRGVADWWNQTMSTRGNDPKTAVRIVVGQRVHFGDLCGVLEEQGGYEHLILPAEYDGRNKSTSIGWSDPRTEQGQLLWEERFDREGIDNLKKVLGSYAASAQLQQLPVPQEGGMIQGGWLQYFNYKPEQFDRIVQSWDTAFKGGPGSYVCGQVWGCKDNQFYLIDQERGRWSFSETIHAIERLTGRHPDCDEVLIEDAANGPAIMDTLRSSLHGIIAVRADGSKQARLSAVSPLFEAGQVWLPKDAPWITDFTSELLQFPYGRNDDQVDAASQALRRLRKQSNSQILTPRRRLIR